MNTDTPTIEFVTHASVLIHAGNIHLLSDPWIEGTAFDDGWALLSPPPQGYSIFERTTHIWFSHEHPDHFAPAVLKKITPEVRARIVVLLIDIEDKKIAKFCRGLGFKEVRELTPAGRFNVWHSLGEGVSMMVGAVDDDSWCAVRSGGKLVLNINDCVLQTAEQLDAIRAHIGSAPDVLLTQFSYAQWSGNPEDVEFRRSEARRKLNEVRLQIERLKPQYVIPFASFVEFCHPENFYMNDGVNRIDDVAGFIAVTGAQPIVLYPGDVWSVGDGQWDSAPAIERYLRDLDDVPSRPLVKSQPVEVSELKKQAEVFLQRLSGRDAKLLTGAALTGMLPMANIWISDYERAFTLSRGGLRAANVSPGRCDVSLSSSALSYMFRFPWGGNTLEVNGRFRKPSGGDYGRFHAWVIAAYDTNKGRPLTARKLIANFGPVQKVLKAVRG